MIQWIASFIVLGIATYYDLKQRLIPDTPWIVGSILGLLLDVLLFRGDPIRYLFKFTPLGLILLLSWRWKLMGEADILAYLTLAVMTPCYPNCVESPIIPAFATFIYSKLLLLFVPLLQLTLNLYEISKDPSLMEGFDEPFWRKALALLFLSPKKRGLGDVPAERLDERGRRKFLLSAITSPLPDKDVNATGWVAPAYPLIPLILVGHVLSMILGDPIIALGLLKS